MACQNDRLHMFVVVHTCDQTSVFYRPLVHPLSLSLSTVAIVLLSCCYRGAGNLACDAVAGGRIIFYDFGMMDELTLPLKRGLVDLLVGIYGNDVKQVVDSLESMDVIRKVKLLSYLAATCAF